MPEDNLSFDKTSHANQTNNIETLKDLIEKTSPVYNPKKQCSIWKILKNFLYEKIAAPRFKNQSERLLEEKIKEQQQRRRFRQVMFFCFFALLIVQYILLYHFVKYILVNNMLAQSQLVLNIIIPATLGETYIIMREMVKFVFTPGDFSTKEQEKPDTNQAKSVIQEV